MSVIAGLIGALAAALAQQPADDGPVATGPRLQAGSTAEAKPPAGSRPAKSAPAAEAAAKALSFEPKTKVDGETLQVILGSRAIFTLGDKGRPVIDRVEEGQLAA